MVGELSFPRPAPTPNVPLGIREARARSWLRNRFCPRPRLVRRRSPASSARTLACCCSSSLPASRRRRRPGNANLRCSGSLSRPGRRKGLDLRFRSDLDGHFMRGDPRTHACHHLPIKHQPPRELIPGGSTGPGRPAARRSAKLRARRRIAGVPAHSRRRKALSLEIIPATGSSAGRTRRHNGSNPFKVAASPSISAMNVR